MSTESIVPSMHMVVFRDTKILVKCRVLVPDVKMPRYLGFGRPCFRVGPSPHLNSGPRAPSLFLTALLIPL